MQKVTFAIVFIPYKLPFRSNRFFGNVSPFYSAKVYYFGNVSQMSCAMQYLGVHETNIEQQQQLSLDVTLKGLSAEAHARTSSHSCVKTHSEPFTCTIFA